jgi:hypothetical protein
MRIHAVLLAAASLAAVLPLHAQDPEDAGPLYKIEINFRDANESGAMADRRYAMLVSDSKKAVFKAGSRSPVVTGSTLPPATGATAGTQFAYLDIGVNIECTLRATGNRVTIHAAFELSSLAPNDSPPAVAGVRNPTVRQTRLELETTVELGKPAVVASIDDPATARKLEVEATVTKAN